LREKTEGAMGIKKKVKRIKERMKEKTKKKRRRKITIKKRR